MALLWAVHPLETEAVAYVVQRTELLMAACLLATLYAFQRSIGSPHAAQWSWAAVAACALGMASKEVMVVAPLLVLLYDRAFVAGSFAEALRLRGRRHTALAATWLILAALLATGAQSRATGLNAPLRVGPWPYLLTQSRARLHYLRLSVWPQGLRLATPIGLRPAPRRPPS